MPDLDTLTLPVLPLSTGVVLPSMVVTLAIETDEARAAADAAIAAGRRMLLVTQSETGGSGCPRSRRRCNSSSVK